MRWALLLLAFTTACAPRFPEGVTAHRSPSCAAAVKAAAAPQGDPVGFRAAYERRRGSAGWGKGLAAIDLPRGFVRLPPPRPIDVEPGDEAREHDDPYRVERLPAEDVRDLLASYRLWPDSDPSTELIATLRLFRRPAPAERPPTLFRYLVAHLDGDREYVTPNVDDDGLARWFNWSEELIDERGRRVVEWGLVGKGCERHEVFEHFVEEGRWIWQVELDVEPSAPLEVLADWLSRFFDAPFAGPLPQRRSALTRQGTQR